MSNAENTSGRYILTLPLKTELYQEHVLDWVNNCIINF